MATILVVDDAATDRQLAGSVVTKMGHTPIYASNGKEAVTRAGESSPSLILLDVVMPGDTGYSTCRKIKSDPKFTDVPVVLVTSKGNPSDVFWAKKQGASDVVTKPYTPDTLESAIQKYLR